jgi:hypothetical protein
MPDPKHRGPSAFLFGMRTRHSKWGGLSRAIASQAQGKQPQEVYQHAPVGTSPDLAQLHGVHADEDDTREPPLSMSMSLPGARRMIDNHRLHLYDASYR